DGRGRACGPPTLAVLGLTRGGAPANKIDNPGDWHCRRPPETILPDPRRAHQPAPAGEPGDGGVGGIAGRWGSRSRVIDERDDRPPSGSIEGRGRDEIGGNRQRSAARDPAAGGQVSAPLDQEVAASRN